MASTESNLVQVSAVLARLAALGSALDIDVTPLFDRAEIFGSSPGRFARVTVSGRFDSVSLMCRWPKEPDAHKRLLDYLAELDTLLSQRIGSILARTRHSRRFIELGTVPGDSERVVTTVRVLGAGSLSDDLALLGAATHAGYGALDRAEGLAQTLAGGDRSAGISDRYEPPGHHSWSIHIARGNKTAEDCADVRDRILEVAGKLGITEAQRGLIGRVHPALARGLDTIASIRIGPGVVYPELALSYPRLDFEDLVPYMEAISTEADTSRKLGFVAGTLEAEAVAAWELELGPDEPLSTRISVDLKAGTLWDRS